MIGNGNSVGEVNRVLGQLARLAINGKAYAANVQAWFDTVCGAANNNANVTPRATALLAAMNAESATGLTQADAEQMVRAFDELLYAMQLFAPEESLHVCGPSTLI